MGGIKITHFLALSVLAPIIISPALLFLNKTWRFFLMSIIFVIFAYLAFYNLSGKELGAFSIFSPDESVITFSFEAHAYSRILVLGFTVIGVLALLYGLPEAKPNEQVAAIWALASAIGISFANDFITLFIFWELLTITTASLIFMNGKQVFPMGYRFLFFHLLGGLLFFVGIIQHYVATGSIALTQPEAGLAFFILGIGFKTAFFPFHIWVAWGYPSASIFSSILMASLTTKVGVYALARILPSHEGFVWMGGIMALVGITCALVQKNMRKLLSYHIVSQVGYMVAGVGLGASLAVDGGLFHLANNVLYKSLLFMTAGAVLFATGTENLHALTHHDEENPQSSPGKPVWKAMPLVTTGAIIGALSIAGIPFFNGYVSKYMLKEAMEGLGPGEWMLLIASIGTAASFCKFVYFGFIKARASQIIQPRATMQISIMGISLLCILLGIRPELISEVLPYGSSLDVYSLSGMWSSLQLALIGVLFFTVMANPLKKGLPVPAWLSVEYITFKPIERESDKIISVGTKILTKLTDGIKNITTDQMLIGVVMIILMAIIFYFGRFQM